MARKKGYVVSSDGVRLYYEIFGEGSDPLLLLSGGPGLSHGELKNLQPLSENATLVYYDQRGTGRSTKTDPKNYTLEASVLDVESIREKMAYREISLLGFAWGAAIAASYALRFPNRVKRLILVGFFSSAEDINAVFKAMRSLATPEKEAELTRYETKGLYKENGRYPEGYLKAVQPLYTPFTSDSSTASTLLTKVFAELSWSVYRSLWGEESEFRITGNLKFYDIRKRLREISVPTLLIFGDSDLVPIGLARRDAEQIRGAELVVLEDAKHYCFLDQQEKFLKAVRDFIRSTPGADRKN